MAEAGIIFPVQLFKVNITERNDNQFGIEYDVIKYKSRIIIKILIKGVNEQEKKNRNKNQNRK